MKNYLPLILTGLLFGAVLILYFNITTLQEENAALKADIAALQQPQEEEIEHHEEEVEVAIFMQRLQVYANKLYFAGINNNEELTHFYFHEMEEVMEEVVEANIVDEGVEISKFMQSMGLESLERFEGEVEEGFDQFEAQYTTFITNCNSCHAVTQHPFIRIKQPLTPIFDNQAYDK